MAAKGWHLIAAAALTILAPVVMHAWFVVERLPDGDAPGYTATVAAVRDAVVRDGRVPPWRPRSFAGSTQFTSTLNERLTLPLALWFGPVFGTRIMFGVAKVASGLAMYALFARCLGSPLSGFVAAYAYAFGAPANYQSAFGGHLDVAIAGVFLPLVALAAVDLVGRPRWPSAVALGIFIAGALGAHWVQGMIAALVPAIVLALRPDRTTHAEPPVAAALAAALLAFLLCAASTVVWLAADGPNHALLPAQDVEFDQHLFVEQSPLMFVNRNGWLEGWLLQHHPPGFIVATRDPEFARRYLGVVALAVTAVGWLLARRDSSLRRWYQTFACLLLVQYWLSLGQRTLLWELGRTFDWPETADAPLAATLTVAAAVALAWAIVCLSRGRRHAGALLVLAIVLVFPAHSLFALAERVLPPLRNMRAPGHFFDLASFSLFGMLGVALVAVARTAKRPAVARSIVVAIGLLVAADFWPSNRAFARGTPARPLLELAQAIGALPGEGGTLRLGMYAWSSPTDWAYPAFGAIGADVGLAWGWLDWQASREWQAYMRAATVAMVPSMNAEQRAQFAPMSDALARIARMKYLVEEIDPAARLAMPAPWRLRWANDDYALWERPDVMPFAWVVRSHVVAEGTGDTPAVAAWVAARDAISIHAAARADLPAEVVRSAALAVDLPRGILGAEPTGAPRVPAIHRRPAPERILLDVDAGPAPAIAFVAEAYHPWWRATVDGRAAPVLRAEYAFMAVPLAPGRHEIEMQFERPVLVRAADSTSTLAWVVLPLAAIAGTLGARHAPRRRGSAPAARPPLP